MVAGILLSVIVLLLERAYKAKINEKSLKKVVRQSNHHPSITVEINSAQEDFKTQSVLGPHHCHGLNNLQTYQRDQFFFSSQDISTMRD